MCVPFLTCRDPSEHPLLGVLPWGAREVCPEGWAGRAGMLVYLWRYDGAHVVTHTQCGSKQRRLVPPPLPGWRVRNSTGHTYQGHGCKGKQTQRRDKGWVAMAPDRASCQRPWYKHSVNPGALSSQCPEFQFSPWRQARGQVRVGGLTVTMKGGSHGPAEGVMLWRQAPQSWHRLPGYLPEPRRPEGPSVTHP